MAAKKYLSSSSGVITEVQATVSSSGAPSDGDIPALDNTGRLSSNMMPVGYAANTKTFTASEALSAGNVVNIWDSGAGIMKVRKADATTAGKEADGFVLSAFDSDATALVYFEPVITVLTGLTGGAVYYLHTTAGGVTATVPTGTGKVVQRIGRALSTTELNFEPGDPITLA